MKSINATLNTLGWSKLPKESESFSSPSWCRCPHCSTSAHCWPSSPLFTPSLAWLSSGMSSIKELSTTRLTSRPLADRCNYYLGNAYKLYSKQSILEFKKLIFRLVTSAGWNDVLEPLLVTPPNCDPKYKSLPNGNCGHPFVAIVYFVSFIIINFMIVINMYIAIILENFNQAHQEEEIGIVEEDLEMFYTKWSKYVCFTFN